MWSSSRALWCVALCAAQWLACKPKAAPVTEPEDAPKATPTPERPAQDEPRAMWRPLPQHPATPMTLKALHLDRAARVGSLSLPGQAEPRPLVAVGLNPCLEGWALQGFYLDGQDEAKLLATPAYVLPQVALKLNASMQLQDIDHPTRAMTLNLTHHDEARLAGTLEVKTQGAQGLSEVTTLRFDGPNQGLVAAEGLGSKGCFSTGYAHRPNDPSSYLGPVTGVWERVGFYTISLWLDRQTRLSVLWRVAPQHIKAGELVKLDLAAVFKAHEQHDVRVMFETLKPADGEQPASWQKEPVEAGQLTISAEKADVAGPLRVELRDIKLTPALRSRAAWETTPLMPPLTLVVGFSTDRRGLSVPHYSPPTPAP